MACPVLPVDQLDFLPTADGLRHLACEAKHISEGWQESPHTVEGQCTDLCFVPARRCCDLLQQRYPLMVEHRSLQPSPGHKSASRRAGLKCRHEEGGNDPFGEHVGEEVKWAPAHLGQLWDGPGVWWPGSLEDALPLDAIFRDHGVALAL